jgi:hypothetical protein
MKVGEVTTSSAGDQDFLADAPRAFEHDNSPSSFRGLGGAHQPGSATTQNQSIEFLDGPHQS